jgi:hypothetical protein
MEDQMMQAVVDAPVDVLEERVRRGAALLFDMEQRGELSAEYHRWFAAWLHLLREYEQLEAA